MAKYFAIGAIAGLVLLAGFVFVWIPWSMHYDQRGGPAIADAIRDASPPGILDVSYSPGNYTDSAAVSITMEIQPPITEDTVAEAEAFVCEVVVPIVQDGDPPEGLTVWVWSPGGRDLTVYPYDTDCPGTSMLSRS